MDETNDAGHNHSLVPRREASAFPESVLSPETRQRIESELHPVTPTRHRPAPSEIRAIGVIRGRNCFFFFFFFV